MFFNHIQIFKDYGILFGIFEKRNLLDDNTNLAVADANKNACAVRRHSGQAVEVFHNTTLLFGGIEGCVIPIYNIHRGEPVLIALGYPRGILE